MYLKKNLQKQAARAEQSKGAHKGMPWTPPTASPLEPPPLFNKPKSKGLTGRCFGCGQNRHYQADCPHMDCTWVKSLQRVQVESPKPQLPRRFTLHVTLNGVEVEALIDTGCGRILVKKARVPSPPKYCVCSAFMGAFGSTVLR